MFGRRTRRVSRTRPIVIIASKEDLNAQMEGQATFRWEFSNLSNLRREGSDVAEWTDAE